MSKRFKPPKLPEPVLAHTYLHWSIYLAPLFLWVGGVAFIVLIDILVDGLFFGPNSMQEMTQFAWEEDGPPLHLTGQALWLLNGMVLLGGLAILTLFIAFWRREFTRLAVTGQRLVLRNRLVGAHIREWRWSEIDRVETRANRLERWLGTGSLVVIDHRGRRIRIAGLTRPGAIRDAARAHLARSAGADSGAETGA